MLECLAAEQKSQMCSEDIFFFPQNGMLQHVVKPFGFVFEEDFIFSPNINN